MLVEALARQGRVDEAMQRLDEPGEAALAPHLQTEMSIRLQQQRMVTRGG